MPGISFGGLTSGLDTKGIVSQLMALERNPQILLQNKLITENQQVSALQGINTRLASVASAAADFAKPEAWTKAAGTSSDASVSVVAGATAASDSISFSVQQVAQRGSWTTPAFTDGQFGPQKITVTTATGQPQTVTAVGGSAQELAAAINATGGGVRATTVRTGDGQYRLLVTSLKSGADGDVTGFSVTNADGSASTMQAPTQLTQGQDAKIDLGFGQLVTSPTNTFTSLIPGADVTVSKVTDQPVTVSTKPDATAVAKQAAGVIGALSVALSEMVDKSKADITNPGVLSGDSTIRGVQQSLAAAFSTAIPGATLADLGIDLARDGTVSIDQTKFAAYAVANPDKAQQLSSAFAGALADVAKKASDPISGLVSTAVISAQSDVKDLTDRISDWDDRLAQKQESLSRQFSALDVVVSANQTALANLTSQLAGLPR